MSGVFSKVLCVKKTTKYERLSGAGIIVSPYI